MSVDSSVSIQMVSNYIFLELLFPPDARAFSRSRSRTCDDKQHNIFTVLGSKKGYRGINVTLLEYDAFGSRASIQCEVFC